MVKVKVGMMRGSLADETRPCWSGDGPRPIRWTAAWYSATDDAIAAPLQVGSREAAIFAMGEVARDALVRDGAPLPVVLLSHGTGGTAASLGWLAVRLAAQGFAVIGVDHHGNTASEPYLAESFLCWWERPRDLWMGLRHGALLPAVSTWTRSIAPGSRWAATRSWHCSALSPRWHVSRPGRRTRQVRASFPISRPAAASLGPEARHSEESWERQSRSFREARVRSALSLAPAPTVRAFTPESLAGIDRPVAMMVGGGDREAPAEAGASWLNTRLPRSRFTPLGPQAGHYVFLGANRSWPPHCPISLSIHPGSTAA